MERFDVVVVGGSFAGMSAALQLARARRSVRLFDTRKPRNRFAASAHGFIGHDGRTPTEIQDLGRGNLAVYPTVDVHEAAVTSIKPDDGVFIVEAHDMGPICASRIILAYGLRDELPAIEGLEEAWGRNVMQCPYCHGYEVRDQKLGVLYTSEASLHQIKLTPDWSPHVSLFLNGHDVSSDDLSDAQERGIAIVPDPVRSIELDQGRMRAVQLPDGSYDLDGLFLITRTHQATDLASQLGCALEDGPFGPSVTVDNLQETSVPGVYAAGDIARPIHTSVWAAADGISAGVFCHQSLLSHKNPYQKKLA
ncbi:MAG: NAD(P)/FAD-dependent oxidoreductase [Pseudomonadota bacterium]